MRVLIFGGAGMLGHKLWQGLRRRCDVYLTVRRESSYYGRFDLFDPDYLMGGIDVRRTEDIIAAFAWARPDVVVNAVGIIKQVKGSEDPLLSLEVNSLFPHRLALVCRARGARLIHFSTDCVFSGKDGRYTEESISDTSDLYGRTKYLGEIQGAWALTLRTSMIGREIETRLGLVEWFLAQKKGQCRGFSRAIFSGLTTQALTDVVADLIAKYPDVSGLYHLSADPISKYDLLQIINEVYGAGVTIERDAEFTCDRSLDSTRFRKVTGWRPEPWRDMIVRMSQDQTPYGMWG